MSYTICSRFKGEHIVYAGYTICTSREHIVYGAFCGSTELSHENLVLIAYASSEGSDEAASSLLAHTEKKRI